MTTRRPIWMLALLTACAPARAAQPEADTKPAAAADNAPATGGAAKPEAEAAHNDLSHAPGAGNKGDDAHESGHSPAHAAGCPECPVSTPAEFDVLMTLRERHARVAAQELELHHRETAVAALEQDVDARVAKLDAAMNKLEERLNLGEPGRAAQQKRIDSLVETLGGLSVKKAGPILAEADPEVAAELLRRVGAARAAALLTVMSPAKAGRFISLGISLPPAKDGRTPTPPEASP